MSSTQVHAVPDDKTLDAYLDASAAILGFSIPLDWRADVLFHLKAVTAAAQLVQAYPVEDELETAPFFQA